MVKSSATNFDGTWFLIRIGAGWSESQGTCVYSYVAKLQFLDPQVQRDSVLCQNFSDRSTVQIWLCMFNRVSTFQHSHLMFWAKGKGIWAAWTSSACLFSSSAVVTELLLPRRPRVQPQWHGGSFHSCRRQGLCKKGPSISFLCHDERARSFFSNLQKLDADWHLKFCFTKGSTKVSASSIFLSQNLWLLCVQSAQDRVLQPLLQELSQAVRFRHTDFNAQAGSPELLLLLVVTWDCRIMDSMDLASIRCAGSQFSAECSKGNKRSPSDYACQAWTF